jgi:hypothetical protein
MDRLVPRDPVAMALEHARGALVDGRVLDPCVG